MNEVGTLTAIIQNQHLILHSDRAVIWEEQKTLIVSDLHLGKAGHFRKHGIPVPASIHHHDLQRLHRLIVQYSPTRVLFLGDLFHSDFNEEWQDLAHLRKLHQPTEFMLVRGNHDILHDGLYERAGIELVKEWERSPFSFTHERADSTLYNLSGHVHPGIQLTGVARQGLRLPCFYFHQEYAILPAFGNFTGTFRIQPVSGARVFAVAESSVIELI